MNSFFSASSVRTPTPLPQDWGEIPATFVRRSREAAEAGDDLPCLSWDELVGGEKFVDLQ